MNRHSWLFTLTFFIAASSPLLGQKPLFHEWLRPHPTDFPRRPEIDGCYELRHVDAGKDAPWPRTLPFAYAPARLQVAPNEPDARSIRYFAMTGPGAMQGPSPARPKLERPHADSIVINYKGLHGVSLRFRYSGHRWVGNVYEITDVDRDPRKLGGIIARRVDCEKWLREFRDFRRAEK